MRLPRSTALLLLLLLLLPATGTAAQQESIYEETTPSRDGIGKVYMGREISFVLGHRGIGWLEREERKIEERPDLLVEMLELAPDAVIADIGAGERATSPSGCSRRFRRAR